MTEHNQQFAIVDATPDASVVYGLQWEPIVGSHLEKQSYKRALELKVSHYVKAFGPFTAFGYCDIHESNLVQGHRYYSAAAIFAQRHSQGVYWARREMPSGMEWIVAAQDGAIVTGTDRLCSHDEASEIVAKLAERYPHIIDAGLDDADFAPYLNDHAELHRLRTPFQSVPVPIKVAVGVLLGFMLLDTGWQQYKAYQARKEAEERAVYHVDAEQLWLNAIDQWQQTVRLGGQEGVSSVLSALSEVPVDVGNWTIASGACYAAETGWNCEAAYARGLGTNMTFKTSAPSNWSVVWDGLNRALARWSIPYAFQPLDRQTLPVMEDVGLGYISRLQRVLPSFESLVVHPPEKVAVNEPTAPDAKGNIVPVPHPGTSDPRLSIPSFQRFQVVAPLRSLLVMPIDQNFQIDSIQFTYTPAGSSSLTKSMFAASLAGGFYVR